MTAKSLQTRFANRYVFMAMVGVFIVAGRSTKTPTVDSDNQGYLLPMVRGFANNQIVGLKEVLALGQILGRTVVLTGLLEGSFEEPKRDRPREIEFDQVFDQKSIAKLQPVITMADLRKKGWNGQMDLVAFFRGKGNDELWLNRWVTGFKVNMTGVPRIEVHRFQCHQEKWIKHLRDIFKGHNMIGVSTFEGVVGDHPRRPGSYWRFEPQTADGRLSPCHEAYFMATRALQRSANLHKLADEFIADELAGGPYLALHVRPYPDVCLKVWQLKHFDVERAEEFCDKPAGHSVFEVLGSAMKVAMATLGTTRLFVMAEPSIRHQVDFLLGKVGIKPHYLSLDVLMEGVEMHSDEYISRAPNIPLQDTSRIKGATKIKTSSTKTKTSIFSPGSSKGGKKDRGILRASDLKAEHHVSEGRLKEAAALKIKPGVISILGILEEEVAIRSKIFFATSGTSSMAGMVIQERQANGLPKNLTITFDELGTLDPKVWPEPWASSERAET